MGNYFQMDAVVLELSSSLTVHDDMTLPSSITACLLYLSDTS